MRLPRIEAAEVSPTSAAATAEPTTSKTSAAKSASTKPATTAQCSCKNSGSLPACLPPWQRPLHPSRLNRVPNPIHIDACQLAHLP